MLRHPHERGDPRTEGYDGDWYERGYHSSDSTGRHDSGYIPSPEPRSRPSSAGHSRTVDSMCVATEATTRQEGVKEDRRETEKEEVDAVPTKEERSMDITEPLKFAEPSLKETLSSPTNAPPVLSSASSRPDLGKLKNPKHSFLDLCLHWEYIMHSTQKLDSHQN